MKFFVLFSIFLGASRVVANPLTININIDESNALLKDRVHLTSNDPIEPESSDPTPFSYHDSDIELDQYPISISEVNGSPPSVRCNGEKIDRVNIDRAAQKGLDLLYQGIVVGDPKKKGEYPHEFKNFEKIPFTECKDKAAKAYEFPLLRGSTYEGKPNQEAGNLRVIFLAKTKTKATYCGTVMHPNQDDNKFEACPKGQ